MKVKLLFSTTLLLLLSYTGGIAAMEINPNSGFESPDVNNLVEEAAVPYVVFEAPQSEIERVKQQHEAKLLATDGVVGVGISRNQIGDDVIVVYLRDRSAQKHIPTQLENFAVVTEVTGQIDAY